VFGKGWEYGRARVVAKQQNPDWLPGVHAFNKWSSKWDYVVDVVPDGGGAQFHASFTATFAPEDFPSIPAVGAEMPVRFRPGGRDVQIDGKAFLAEVEAAEDAKHQQFEATAAASPGTPPSQTPSPGEPTVRVTTSTDPAEIQRMRERLERLAAENPGSVVKFSVGGPAGGMPDRLDRLQQLADLHDRGALTDAEFAAEKAKLLADS
jgi:hypothetical protein